MTTTTARQQSAADALIARVGEVGALFRKDTDGTWRVVCRAELAEQFATITVTKADGTTKRVLVTRINRTGERVGIPYAIVDFSDSVSAPRSLTREMDAADAAGRRINGNGQIWD